MRCPWCGAAGTPRALHAHLAGAHREEVRVEERLGVPVYAVGCPLCGEAYEAPIKPRGRDPRFLEEFREEIALVGFDVLVNHLLAAHPREVDAPGGRGDVSTGGEEEGAAHG